MDPKFIKKIINNYNSASSDYKKDPSQKSIHWQSYNSRIFNEENLINFRRKNGLSLGLDDAIHDERLSLKFFSSIIIELGEKFVKENLEKRNIGNSSYSYKFFDYYVDYNKLIHIHWFNDLRNHIFEKKHIAIYCEIGGGYGSLSEIILNNYSSKLISIDLPEANLLTNYYLQESFPEKKFYIYEDYLENNELKEEDINNYDIFILPPWVKISNNVKIDLFINTRSMMEMENKTINKYFDIIHSHIVENGFFLNINRYEKETVGEKVRIANYPYDENWEVVLSKKSFQQNHVHFLITQRKFSNLKNSIIDELARINKLGKPYYIQNNKFLATKIFINNLFKFIAKFLLRLLFSKSFINKLGNSLKNFS